MRQQLTSNAIPDMKIIYTVFQDLSLFSSVASNRPLGSLDSISLYEKETIIVALFISLTHKVGSKY